MINSLTKYVKLKKKGIYDEDDFQQNNHARRTQGQLGNDLFEQRTMKSVLLDAMLKYRGFAAMMSYMSRTTNENAVTFNPLDLTESNFAYVGNGFDYQISYNTKKNYEFIARYSLQNVGNDIEKLAPKVKEYSLGVTKYIWEHAFKLQSEINYDVLEYFNGNVKDNWYLRFQVEIGI
mgnify:CR=1 FL=1